MSSFVSKSLIFVVGGPWILSNKRPNCLKPMIKKREYQEFAAMINNAMSWNHYGSEMFMFYLISFLLPPFGGLVMVRFLTVSRGPGLSSFAFYSVNIANIELTF